MNWAPWQTLNDHAGMRLWHWVIIVLSVGVAIWLILRIRAYFREDSEDADQTLEMLTQFRDLHQEGGLSDDEFRLIRSRLARTARATLATGKAKPDAVSAETGPSVLQGPQRPIPTNLTPSDSTATKLTEEEMTSSRKQDEETD